MSTCDVVVFLNSYASSIPEGSSSENAANLTLSYTGIFLSRVWLFLYLLSYYRSLFAQQFTFTLNLCSLSPITLTLEMTSLPPYWLVLRNDSMMETSNPTINLESLDIFVPAVSGPSNFSYSWPFLCIHWKEFGEGFTLKPFSLRNCL